MANNLKLFFRRTLPFPSRARQQQPDCTLPTEITLYDDDESYNDRSLFTTPYTTEIDVSSLRSSSSSSLERCVSSVSNGSSSCSSTSESQCSVNEDEMKLPSIYALTDVTRNYIWDQDEKDKANFGCDSTKRKVKPEEVDSDPENGGNRDPPKKGHKKQKSLAKSIQEVFKK